MTKMSIAPEDRPRVKLECLRMVATLKLDPARSQLIGMFMNSYLKLTAAEAIVYNQDFRQWRRKKRKSLWKSSMNGRRWAGSKAESKAGSRAKWKVA